jgi:hypothetical protein
MNRKIWTLALILSVAACRASETQLFHHSGSALPPDPAPQASDLTIDQLLAKYVAARGGEQKLKGLQSIKMTGTWEADSAVPATVWIAPGRYARRIAQGAQVTMINVVDGQTSWELNPRKGIVKPTPMPAKDTARFRRLADPQGPLFDAKAKGDKIEVVGKQPLKSAQVYKIKVTSADGTVNYYYLDAKTFLPLRALGSQYVPQLDKNIGIEVSYGDFRDVGGVKFPFREAASAPEANYSQTLTWDKIEINQPLDESAFKPPKS